MLIPYMKRQMLVLSVGLMGVAGFANANETMQPEAVSPAPAIEAQGGLPVTEEQVDNFVQAYTEVQQINQEYSAQLQEVSDAEEAASLQQEAQQKMQEAVSDSGLTVPEYQRIANLAGQHPAVRQMIEDKLGQ